MEGADVPPRAVVQSDAVAGVPAGTAADPKGGERALVREGLTDSDE